MARLYIYRNLHRKCFSVKLRGKVIGYIDSPAMLIGASFQVSEAGRQRVIRDKQKNVHAYICCDKIAMLNKLPDGLTEAYYNPYKQRTFTAAGKLLASSPSAYLGDGKAYI